MEALIQTHKRVINTKISDKKRYLFHEINWNNRLIGITGQRGTGKTTLLIQKIKEAENQEEHLYISADSLFIYDKNLFEIALSFRNTGGKYLYIDEVHKYENWSGVIKHIYDTIPDLNIIFTGSSILDILKSYGDLSRRAVHYKLHGMSFREYLYFETNQSILPTTIEEIITSKFKPEIELPLMHFKNYLSKGYYPFYTQDEFELRLENVINTVLEVDLVHYLDLKPATIIKLKKLLQIIAESVPFKPNVSKISELTQISRIILPDYFSYLERAGLISQLVSSTKGIRSLNKIEKMFLQNTNLSYVFSKGNPDIGNLRETFFISQFLNKEELSIPEKGDFQYENITFEIGGKNKTNKQLQGLENAYLLKDDIEFSYSNSLPLWHFGFLY
jgi:predicted AAA+ superfamily ATPase